ncbi:MAG TPA: DUF5698 domain-containing protein [Fusibacter sp.]|jgi:uncharacterized protein YebE (UPF0316 family)|nr:DUF5698 domain-containing protein [Fusibacter sp.]
MIYLFIVLAKIVEVSMATVRMVLITKGERKIGAIIAFFEVSLWVILVSTVLDNIMENPLKIVAYALGFSLGNYLGSWIEEKIGIGLAEMQIILKEEQTDPVVDALRDKGFAVTVIAGQGKNHPRSVLLMYVSRNKIKECANFVRSVQDNAVITVSDKKGVYGGYGMLRK